LCSGRLSFSLKAIKAEAAKREKPIHQQIDFPPWAARGGGEKNYEIAYQSISHSSSPRLNLFSLTCHLHWESRRAIKALWN
jgi:hypothetical protein